MSIAAHRCEENTVDGEGILIQMPHSLSPKTKCAVLGLHFLSREITA